MALTTRRQLIQQTAVAAAVFYGRPMKELGRTLRMFGTREQNAAAIDSGAIRKLASEITGHVITPEAPNYETWRLVENRAFDRRPALIVRVANTSDVARVLDFGQKQKLPLAVRSGGHSAAGFGVCDGGVVIDLSGMKKVEVDAEKRAARAEAGCLGGDLNKATQRFGLATTLGACPTVGIAGLTLGGGEGALMPKYGAACDNLLSARVVAVDGREVEASQNSNPDLFWAIRGGGGNFGVVTALEYRLHPVSEVLTGALVYPAGRIPELLQTYVKFMKAAPDEMNGLGQIFPSERGPTFMMLVDYCGQPSLGNDLLKPLRAPIKPQADSVKVMSYLEAQSTAFSGPPNASFATDLFLPELNEAAIAAITTATQDAPRFRVQIVSFHGAVTRLRLSDTAFPLRETGYEVLVSSYWNTPEEKASAVKWAKALGDKLRPFARGAAAQSEHQARLNQLINVPTVKVQHAPEIWVRERRESPPRHDLCCPNPYHQKSDGNPSPCAARGRLRFWTPVQKSTTVRNKAESLWGNLSPESTSPQCQPTTHTKENNLDRIEHALYTSRTCITGRDHR